MVGTMKNIELQLEEISEEEINSIKQNIENSEDEFLEKINDKIEDLLELKISSYENLILKGKLYFKIFNILKEIKEFLKKSKVYDYLNKSEIDKDFSSNMEIYNNNDLGKYFAGERIKEYVQKNEKDINNLINFFFKIFQEE